MPPVTADSVAARRWLWLGVGVLLVAGGFALLLVIARMPPFDALVTDPGFFRRCLVVHVQLSLVCWFYAFTAALLMTLPAAPWGRGLTAAGPWLALLGVVTLGASAFAPGARPVMSNYVPMVDHWLAELGLGLFATGVLCAVLSRRLLPGAGAPALRWPGASHAAPGVRAAGTALLLAILTLLATLPQVPGGAAAEVRYEVLFWGVGHVLQLASVAAMLAVWLWAIGSATGRAVLSPRAAGIAFGVLLLPWLVAPLLPAAGAWSATYKVGFTRLMQFGLFPVVLWVLGACLRAMWRARRAGLCRLGDGRVLGFLASAALTVLGFGLGALIRDTNTMIPAHYHANIGAVTAAFMMASFALLRPVGLNAPERRWAAAGRWQPALFAVGQTTFALGFALAGSQGMARKVYGQEQAARSAIETFGLTVMGIGGFVAIAAGVLFLTLHIRAALGSAAPFARTSTLTAGERHV